MFKYLHTVILLTTSKASCSDSKLEYLFCPGETAVLECNATQVNDRIYWQLANKSIITRLTIGERINENIPQFSRLLLTGDRQKGEYNLRISNTTVLDAGIYMCLNDQNFSKPLLAYDLKSTCKTEEYWNFISNTIEIGTQRFDVNGTFVIDNAENGLFSNSNVPCYGVLVLITLIAIFTLLCNIYIHYHHKRPCSTILPINGNETVAVQTEMGDIDNGYLTSDNENNSPEVENVTINQLEMVTDISSHEESDSSSVSKSSMDDKNEYLNPYCGFLKCSSESNGAQTHEYSNVQTMHKDGEHVTISKNLSEGHYENLII